MNWEEKLKEKIQLGDEIYADIATGCFTPSKKKFIELNVLVEVLAEAERIARNDKSALRRENREDYEFYNGYVSALSELRRILDEASK